MLVVKGRRKHLGKNHPMCAESVQLLVQVCSAKGDEAEVEAGKSSCLLHFNHHRGLAFRLLSTGRLAFTCAGEAANTQKEAAEILCA